MKNLKNLLSLLIFSGLFTVMTGCTSTPTKKSTDPYFDNSAITTRVKTAITHEDSFKVSEIDVQSFTGVVQLSGFVDSKQNSMKAQQITENIEGVIFVENNLVVK